MQCSALRCAADLWPTACPVLVQMWQARRGAAGVAGAGAGAGVALFGDQADVRVALVPELEHAALSDRQDQNDVLRVARDYAPRVGKLPLERRVLHLHGGCAIESEYSESTRSTGREWASLVWDCHHFV